MLEELNFNEPISATLIFDDSDEETKSCIEDLQTNQPGTEDNVASHSIKELINKELELKKYLSMTESNLRKVEEEIKNSESQTEALGNFIIRRQDSDGKWIIVGNDEADICKITKEKQIETPLDMPPLDDSALSNSTTLKNTNSLSTIDTYKPDKRTEKSKRKKSLNGGKISKRKLSAHIEKKEVESIDKHLNYIEINPTSNQNYNQAASGTELSPVLQQHPLFEQYSDRAQLTHNNQRILHEQQTNALELLPRSLSVNQSVIQYISSSLQSVSENMIYIINSYHAYVALCKTGAPQSLIEQSKKHYINTRNYLFELSYKSVVINILPKEKDVEFVKKFLDVSIKLAQSKLLPYTYTQFSPLYLELVHWAKNKQKYIDSMNLANSNPELTQLLLQKDLQPPVGHNIKQNQNTNLQREVQKQNCTIARNCSGHDSFGITQTNIVGPTYSSQSQPRVYALPPKNLPTYGQSQMYNMQQAKSNFSCVSNQIIQSTQFELNKLLPQQSLRSMQTVGSSWNNTEPTMTVQSSQKEVPVHNVSIFSCQNNGLANLNTALRAQCYVEADPSQNRQNLRLEIPPQVETNRSSISRDSGFMSPFDFNASSDQSSNIQAEQSSHPSPFITHVTSLHPSASYIEDGPCVVCGKTTRKKCVGCYKFYYCSRDCQCKDWNKHMPHCNQKLNQQNNNVV